MEENNYYIRLLIQYFNFYDIKSNPIQLQLVLESAPSYPSVLSITQACIYYGLPTDVYKADYSGLLRITRPAIVQIKSKDNEKFVLLSSLTENRITLFDATTNSSNTISSEEFLLKWTGIVVLSEKSTTKHKVMRDCKPILGFAVVIICLFLFLSTTSLNSQHIICILQYFLKLVGLFLSYGLICKEISDTHTIFDKFCHMGKSFSCSDVVQSKASKLFGLIPLADVGFTYFVVGLLLLTIGFLLSNIVPFQQILFYLSICSAPFILFSVLYQKIKVKKWCLLCLSVMGVLLVEVILFIVYHNKLFPGELLPIGIYFIVSFIIAIGILNLVKSYILNQTKTMKSRSSELKLKRNPMTIMTFFEKQKVMPIQLIDNLIIGNIEAPMTITTLINPMCTPCKNRAIEIIELIENYPSLIQWHIRFEGMNDIEYNRVNVN